MPHEINIYSCRYYNAVIDEILEDDTCTVTFEEWGNTDITQVCCFGRTQVCCYITYTWNASIYIQVMDKNTTAPHLLNK